MEENGIRRRSIFDVDINLEGNAEVSFKNVKEFHDNDSEVGVTELDPVHRRYKSLEISGIIGKYVVDFDPTQQHVSKILFKRS